MCTISRRGSGSRRRENHRQMPNRPRNSANASTPGRVNPISGMSEVQPAVAPPQHAPERQEQPQQEERFGVADLEERGQRTGGEERRPPSVAAVVVHAHRAASGTAPGTRGSRRRARSSDAHRRPTSPKGSPTSLREVCVERHERPLVLGDLRPSRSAAARSG